jgi:hypothetical protein
MLYHSNTKKGQAHAAPRRVRPAWRSPPASGRALRGRTSRVLRPRLGAACPGRGSVGGACARRQSWPASPWGSIGEGEWWWGGGGGLGVVHARKAGVFIWMHGALCNTTTTGVKWALRRVHRLRSCWRGSRCHPNKPARLEGGLPGRDARLKLPRRGALRVPLRPRSPQRPHPLCCCGGHQRLLIGVRAGRVWWAAGSDCERSRRAVRERCRRRALHIHHAALARPRPSPSRPSRPSPSRPPTCLFSSSRSRPARAAAASACSCSNASLRASSSGARRYARLLLPLLPARGRLGVHSIGDG